MSERIPASPNPSEAPASAAGNETSPFDEDVMATTISGVGASPEPTPVGATSEPAPAASEAPASPAEVTGEITPGSPEDPEAAESRRRVTAQDMLAITKVVGGAAASVAGLKGFYDVPAYVYQRQQLYGDIAGTIKYGEGLGGAAAELLEKREAMLGVEKEAQESREARRQELHQQLSQIIEDGTVGLDKNSEEYRDRVEYLKYTEAYRSVEDQLSGVSSTAVREAIADLNRRFSLTREGGDRRPEDVKRYHELTKPLRDAQAELREKEAALPKANEGEKQNLELEIAGLRQRIIDTEQQIKENPEYAKFKQEFAARDEMARLLREHRKAESIDRKAIKQKVDALLDTYTNQKVDGVTAAKEGIRSFMVASGAYALGAVTTLALDGVGFVKKVHQEVRQRKAAGEDIEYSGGLLSRRFAEEVSRHWANLRGIDESGTKSRGRRWVDRATAAAKFGRVLLIGASVGINTDAYADNIEKLDPDRLSTLTVEDIAHNFSGGITMMAERLKSIGHGVGSFFSLGAASASGTMPSGGGGVSAVDDFVTRQLSQSQSLGGGTATPPAGGSPATPAGSPAAGAGKPPPIEASAAAPASASPETPARPTVDAGGRILPNGSRELPTSGTHTDASLTPAEGGGQRSIPNDIDDMAIRKGLAPEFARIEAEARTTGIRHLLQELRETPDYKVNAGDNIWKIIEQKVSAHQLFHDLKPGQQDYVIDYLKDKVTAMNAAELKAFGISSGNANLIHPGEDLDFSKIIDQRSLNEAFAGADKLTPAQIDHIESYDQHTGVKEHHPVAAPDAERPPSAAPESTRPTGSAEAPRAKTKPVGALFEQFQPTPLQRQNANIMLEQEMARVYPRALFGAGEHRDWEQLRTVPMKEVLEALKLDHKFGFWDGRAYGDADMTILGSTPHALNSSKAVHTLQPFLVDIQKYSGLSPDIAHNETVGAYLQRALAKALALTEGQIGRGPMKNETLWHYLESAVPKNK